MSWKYSTGLRNALLEQVARVPHAVAADTISFGDGDGTGGRDTINDSGNGLNDFLKSAYITVLGSVSNNVTSKILTVSVGTIEVAEDTLVTEVAGSSVILASAEGGSYRGVFRNGTLKIFTGAQPSSANNAETGNELCQITLASGVFVAGSPANGLNFGQIVSAILHKEVDEVWSGENGADGQAGWFRLYNNAAVSGASTTAIRLDGACATSGAQLNLTSVSLVNGVTTTIDQVNLTLPSV